LLVVLAALAALAALALGACGRSTPPANPELKAAIADLEKAVAAAKAEVRRLEDVDDLENLAGIYGHYVDKNRHDDVADLFAPEGVVEIYGRGAFLGQDRVREYMHNLSPGSVGPRDGSLFNHMHLQTVIDVQPDGKTAFVRSRPFIMFGIMNTNAQWGVGVYENVFAKQDGIWKIAYLHGYYTMYTNYEDGWAKRATPIFGVYARLPPDRPQSVPYAAYPAAFVPAFHYKNPVTGRTDYYGDPIYHDPQAK
jgi:SnoaL-like protein